MWHMPYERMQPDDEAEDEPTLLTHQHASGQDEPGRTPHTAEGEEGSERKMPLVEPDRTPGSAEGE